MLKGSTKFNKTSFMLLILGLGIGIFLTAQWKAPITRIANPISPYIALRDTRDDLAKERDDDKAQIATLQKQISEEEENLKKNTASKQTIEEVEKDKEKVGLTEKNGQGIIITLDDSKDNEISINSITHAADLRDIINFLWKIGANAISINNERIVFPTSIDCIINTILINSTKTVPPFQIKVLGDSKNIEDQLNNSANLKDIKKRVKNEGLIFNVNRSDDVIIPAYNGSFNVDHVTIVK